MFISYVQTSESYVVRIYKIGTICKEIYAAQLQNRLNSTDVKVIDEL